MKAKKRKKNPKSDIEVEAADDEEDTDREYVKYRNWVAANLAFEKNSFVASKEVQTRYGQLKTGGLRMVHAAIDELFGGDVHKAQRTSRGWMNLKVIIIAQFCNYVQFVNSGNPFENGKSPDCSDATPFTAQNAVDDAMPMDLQSESDAQPVKRSLRLRRKSSNADQTRSSSPTMDVENILSVSDDLTEEVSGRLLLLMPSKLRY